MTLLVALTLGGSFLSYTKATAPKAESKVTAEVDKGGEAPA